MKVRISTISTRGLNIKDKLPLAELNARMNEGCDNDIHFVEAPLVDVTMQRASGGAELKGTVRAKFRQPCAHCLDVLERELEISPKMIFAPKPTEDSVSPADDYADDVGLYYYTGDHVDLEEPLQEALILALSRYWHPPLDSKGCCQQCGRNVHQETTSGKPTTVNFGALLEQARRKKSQR